MRAVVVDDEPIARRVLREELEAFPDVEVVSEADNGRTALLQVATYKPDVVFLDLQMPVLNGFDTISGLGSADQPAVIILTAFDEFAIRAFEAGAVDYLLKPVGQVRLQKAIEKVRRLLPEPQLVAEKMAQLQEIVAAADERKSAGAKTVQKIVGKHRGEFFVLNVPDVLAFQADGDLTWIITAERRYLATQNLMALEEKFQGSCFRRIHRNALINVDQIRKMTMVTSQRWLVTLSNGQQFTASKRQAKNVRDVLQW